MNRNTNLIFNLVLLACVGVLFFLHFKPGNTEKTIQVAKVSSNGKTGIAYVNADSLLANYELFKKMKGEMEEKDKRSQQEMEIKARKFEEEVGNFQKLAPSLSRDVAEKRQIELKKKQDELLMRREELTQQLASEDKRITEELYKTIQDYLKAYTKDKPFQVVLSYSKGSSILYADENLDITKDVIEGLNKDYKSKQK